MRQTLTRAFAALALAVLIARPASAANKEHQQLMADIRMLQEQTQQLQNLIGSMNTALNTALTEALKAVNVRIDEQTGVNRKAFADQKLVIDTMSSDLRVVREKVDDNNVRIGSLSQEVDALRQALQQLNTARPPAATDSADAAAPAGAPPGDGAPNVTPPAAPRLNVGVSPQLVFESARSDYFQGLYDLAIKGFESFILSFPKSQDADDAQVLIGHSYLAQGKNDQAVEAYDKAIRTYPGGNAIPDAYYKKGVALSDLKKPDLAREAFEYVVKNYPDSDAGRLAKQRLATPPGK